MSRPIDWYSRWAASNRPGKSRTVTSLPVSAWFSWRFGV
jgi:hypothetical protein